MKVSGFLLLLAGWFLALSAIVLFREPGPRAIFIFVGLGVEVLGLVFAFRSHQIPREEKR